MVSEREVILFITDHPGLTTKEIAQQMDAPHHQVCRHVQNLRNQGELEIKKQHYAIEWEEMIDWKKIPNEKRPDNRKDR